MRGMHTIQEESTLNKTLAILGGLAGGMVLVLAIVALYVILEPDLVAFVRP